MVIVTVLFGFGLTRLEFETSQASLTSPASEVYRTSTAYGLMFFLAGLVTPRALAAKGPRRFVVDRVRRLGIPVIAYVLIAISAMNFSGDHAMGQGESVGDYFRDSERHDIELGVSWVHPEVVLEATVRGHRLPLP